MKRIFRYVLGSSIALIFALITEVTPRIYFGIQDEEIIGNEKSKKVTSVDKSSSDQEEYGIEDKINMLSEETNIEYVLLDTGNMYSLYEARLQCFRELSKISSLRIDVHGPVGEEIDIKPYLVINLKVPSQTFILWKGEIVIDKVVYKIVLDEESGKIIKLESDSFEETDFNIKIIEEWEEYLQDDK